MRQRVAGWLATTLQGPFGLLLVADRVEYSLSGRDGVVVTWQGGPLAVDVAEHLVDQAGEGMPVEVQRDPTRGDGDPGELADVVRSRMAAWPARLTVAGCPVMLVSRDPRPEQRPPFPRWGAKPWSWPQPLQEDGSAFDAVVWQGTTPEDIGLATVIRMPATALLDHDHRWCEDGCLVVNAEHSVPAYAGPQQHNLHRQAHQTPGVLLRAASPEWTQADATTWIAEQIETRGPYTSAAVLWPDQCLMHDLGLRMHATATANPLGFVTMVPAVLLASVTHSPHRRPPRGLRVHPFGNAGYECTFQVETTGTFELPWHPPERIYYPVPRWSAATAVGST